jgi:hypothetical protein
MWCPHLLVVVVVHVSDNWGGVVMSLLSDSNTSPTNKCGDGSSYISSCFGPVRTRCSGGSSVAGVAHQFALSLNS